MTTTRYELKVQVIRVVETPTVKGRYDNDTVYGSETRTKLFDLSHVATTLDAARTFVQGSLALVVE